MQILLHLHLKEICLLLVDFFSSLNLFFYIENKTGLTTDSNINDECKSMELALFFWGGGGES